MARASVFRPDGVALPAVDLPGSGIPPAWVERARHPSFLADLSELHPLARILATTDGTVTEILEAWADDRVAVGELAQVEAPLTRPVELLEVGAHRRLLRREVLLVGVRTKRPLLHAESLIVAERLPDEIRDGLREGSTPIGKLLRRHRLETYREFLYLGRAGAGPLALRFRISPSDPVIERTYRVFAGGRPVMLINESFPQRMMPSPGA